MRYPPFHLAVPVSDLETARHFYEEVLGCREGRSSDEWIDFDLRGHQLSLHRGAASGRHRVDEQIVPIPHFGLILTPSEWDSLARRLEARGARFALAPSLRFENSPAEQRTMFVLDECGNALEFKAFTNPDRLFT